MLKIQGLIKSPIYKNSTEKLADRLIFLKIKKRKWGEIEHNFTIINTKSQKAVGSMICIPSKVYRKDLGEVNSLYIAYLSAIKNMGQGIGSALFNLAKIYSKQIGCDGNIHLDSSGCILPNKAPHIFYRKLGMSSNSLKIDQRIDKYIRNGKFMSKEEIPVLRMYYPPIANATTKTPLYRKFLLHLKGYFVLRI